MKQISNREKFLKLVSADKTNTIERVKFRLAKRDLIISSYRVVLQRCNDDVINKVLKCVDMTNGWCEMFDEDGGLMSPTFKDLGFSYEYFTRKVYTKEIGKSAYWRPKDLRILK